MKKPTLYIIIPCYNEEKVLPITCEMFLDKITELIQNDKIDDSSKIMFVNDGSKDKTWNIGVLVFATIIFYNVCVWINTRILCNDCSILFCA